MAKPLQEVYGCSTISMDHFFLQPHQCSAARLQEPGGNVDYERFQAEVAAKLKGGEPFRYQIFNCQDGSFIPSPVVETGPLTVVEGYHSHHPKFAQIYDPAVFLTITPRDPAGKDPKAQRPGDARRFVEEWIPLEERHFSTFRIAEHSELCISTDQ